MALVKGRANPLNLLALRKVYRLPPNFTKIKLTNLENIKLTELWIYQNLDGRYSFIKTTGIGNDNKLTTVYEVGFEDARELTMFTLGCPYLHRS
jgi:hypothetical protein